MKVDYAIDIVSLSKGFERKTRSSYTTLKSALLGFFKQKKSQKQNFENYKVALHELTMRIPQGSSLGVIGRNGSGKSTRLKLITGIYKPDHGHVKVNGRVAALIELGAGFHPDFTGRENVFLAGAMYGLSRKQIQDQFDQIVEFAELAEVIDQPVRTYSSGMFMRLGFSVAIHIDPDVLLIDEVLAVGDEGFVSKCKQKITELRKNNKTLLLVSHDLAAVERWCDEVLWLHEGKVKDRGDPRRVIDHYRQFIERGEEDQLILKEHEEHLISESTISVSAEEITTEKEAQRWGSREIEIISVNLHDDQKNSKRVFRTREKFQIIINFKLNEAVTDVVFGIGITRSDGLQVYGSNTDLDRFTVPSLKAAGSICLDFSEMSLLEGAYYLDVAVHKTDGYPYDYHKHALEFHVKNAGNQIGVWSPNYSWNYS